MIDFSNLRRLRKSRHYTLNDLSRQTGYTASFLSQIERGLKEPSLTTLRKLSEALGVPVASFFFPAETDSAGEDQVEKGYSLVRRDERRNISIPGLSVHCESLTISPAAHAPLPLDGMIYTIPPHTFASEGMVCHTYDECAYILSGEATVYLPDTQLRIVQGDCIYIASSTPHNFLNSGDDDCSVLSFNN